jgi:hypothetical protein
MRGLIIFILHQILLGDEIEEEETGRVYKLHRDIGNGRGEPYQRLRHT